MLKVYCDRCGKEITPFYTQNREWRGLHLVTYGEDYPLDLCLKCADELAVWLKEETQCTSE